MADEEFTEPDDIQLSLYRDGQYWESNFNRGRSPGNNVAPIGHPYHRLQETHLQQSQHNNNNNHRKVYSNRGGSHYSQETESRMGHYNYPPPPPSSNPQNNRQKDSFYSPPGTSYTIVEKNSMPTPRGPRNSQLGSEFGSGPVSSSFHTFPQTRTYSSNHGIANKKRPISPEQILKCFGSANAPPARTNNNNSSNINQRLKSPASINNAHNNSRFPVVRNDQLPVRTISMTRDTPPGSGHGFGICVKGGAKHPNNVGVYISRVEEGSLAEKAGLKPGDSILEVNGVPFTNISHEEALRMLKSCHHISMTIRTTPLSQRLSHNKGGSWILKHSYSWVNRNGNPVSPPADYVRNNATNNWTSTKIYKERIRKVELTIDPGQTLGLVIRGGIEYGLGIFVTGVDENSVAQRSGLQVGDQILDVNGNSFLDITHDEAVSILKSHNKMKITIREVGKIPSSCATYDSDPSWDYPQQQKIHPKMPRSETIQMVEEKASIVLEKSEFTKLLYYVEEYFSKKMSFDTFLTVMVDLLNTPEKYTLMTELRELVLPEDKLKFDEAIYRRHSLDDSKSNYFNSKSRSTIAENMHGRLTPEIQKPSEQNYSKINRYYGDQNFDLCAQENDDLRSPSEDSGLGLGPFDSGNGHHFRRSNIPRRYADSKLNRLISEEDLGQNNYQEYNDIHAEKMGRGKRRSSAEGISKSEFEEANMCGYFEEFRSQIGGWTQKFKDWYWGGNSLLAQKLGEGCDINSNDRENTRNGNSINRNTEPSSPSKTAHVIADPYGNLRITVKKSKPLLGIAIEGGANTRHPLPRIINIHEHGAAYEAGGLEVGQLILKVEGVNVQGMQHQEVARMIAEMYANRDKPDIEFLVIEAKKSNMEPKPTALIFLDP